MIDAMQPMKNPIKVDISGADFTNIGTCQIKAISSAQSTTGNVIVMVDILADDGVTYTNVAIPGPGVFTVEGITKVRQSGTTATNIVLWKI
jgi:hypothetical protein